MADAVEAEHGVLDACKRGDYETAASLALEAFGPEIYGFLVAQFGGQTGPADDVFSDFSEDLWNSLATFEWRCSVRAWSYRLARSASSRYRRAAHNRADRRVSITSSQIVRTMVDRARTSTRPYLRSDVKTEFQRLREKLGPEDQDLLVLRVDRGLSWREVAVAMQGSSEPIDDDSLRRVETALRQRFVEVKKRLKRLAEEAGLL